jgi:hypothetical protein
LQSSRLGSFALRWEKSARKLAQNDIEPTCAYHVRTGRIRRKER